MILVYISSLGKKENLVQGTVFAEQTLGFVLLFS